MSQRIEWTRERRRILLPVLILAPFPTTDLTGVDAKALIDTGSSISGVAVRLAEQLELMRLGKRPLTSPQGAGQVERCAFRVGFWNDNDSTALPEFPFVFEEVIGIELTNVFEFSALIGMDILSQCDFGMSRTGACSLSFG